MPETPIDVYGCLQQYTADKLPDFVGGIWVNQMPEDKKFPFCVLEDRGFDTEWQYESVYVDAGSITFHCFAASVDQARNVGNQVKDLYGPYNSESPIPTDGGFKFIEVTRTRYQLHEEPEPDIEGVRVWRFEITFAVKIQGAYANG